MASIDNPPNQKSTYDYVDVVTKAGFDIACSHVHSQHGEFTPATPDSDELSTPVYNPSTPRPREGIRQQSRFTALREYY